MAFVTSSTDGKKKKKTTSIVALYILVEFEQIVIVLYKIVSNRGSSGDIALLRSGI